jgi:hypothetical protein
MLSAGGNSANLGENQRQRANRHLVPVNDSKRGRASTPGIPYLNGGSRFATSSYRVSVTIAAVATKQSNLLRDET